MFLFCIGGAKCGSSWLFEYLRKHPECYLRSNKELRYFNDIEDDAIKSSIKIMDIRLQIAEDLLSRADPKDVADRTRDLLDLRDYQRVLMTCHQDKNAYFRYMMTGLRQEKLVADITPDYGRISAEMLGKMVGVANETRFVFLMRNPVDRLWSHVRMQTSQILVDGVDFEAQARATLARSLAGQEERRITRYCDYASTLAKMEAVIPADRRFVMFYEDLMTQDGLRRLCKFLGIKPVAAQFEKQVHQGRAASMTEEDRAAARRYLRPQYEAVASRFPVLPKAWQKTMAEGFA